MSAVSQDEADRVLRLKSRERETHACYPCKKRKVKCDGNRPCRTCQRRNHPQICTYNLSRHSRRRSSVSARQNISRSASPTTAPASENGITGISSRPDDGLKNYVYSGDNSVVSILRLRASDANESVARELGSVLGLQNTFSNYPFMDSKTPHERWKSLLGVLPQRTEVLKYFHYYRVTAYPFNPILADMDRFESDLCTYLNAHAMGELRDTDKITDRWATDKSIGHISLLLATLAAGAHYSDVTYPQRLKISTEFARRSFHALRLANFLFRPSLDIIQALLILGNTLQNMGQSDAAWALLGTTVRLAQTMGLHTERSTIYWPEYVQTKARALWSTIVWQDSLLCLCYDRPPIVSVTGWSLDDFFFERQDLSYSEVMHLICRLGLDIMRPDSIGVAEVDQAIEGLQRLDNAYQRAQPYLQRRENCTTLQQHLENLALRMHISFCVSVICRPAMKQSPPNPVIPSTDILRARAKGSLMDASRAFLDFQALSVVPLRSWSMVHTVLSSTLLLCIWEETRNDPECRSLQERVIGVFSSSDSRTSDDSSANSDSDSQWLSARHIRALVTLRGALDREWETGAGEHENGAATGVNAGPSAGAGQEGYLDMLNPFDISPVTYLDSIMNVPLFDFTQENGFL
ncbi:transcriptional regulator family: Fungal Specific TF [Penicillium macrosclerotiorum]|uniref:transcriptional regulator family: Fungal Specific TF n=1 Tax=Penicillium macrosclerotiorum TaxID=303699 RepID=UPI002549B562|nr:transcriptional regulator family: Fungal Specific TF [Penicillium macrosclerotiorum]KAJ5689836.1 transcriptional regulator family: Fungal Specific TF [Penicillium macrosclerotiorum]